MKKEIYYCDICGTEKENSELRHFVTGNKNFLDLNVDRLDICEDCVENFKKYLKAIRSPLFYDIN